MGAFVTVPFVLIVSPMVGWFFGKWLDKKMDTAPLLMYVFLIMGLMAGGYECYRIIKKFGNEI